MQLIVEESDDVDVDVEDDVMSINAAVCMYVHARGSICYLFHYLKGIFSSHSFFFKREKNENKKKSTSLAGLH